MVTEQTVSFEDFRNQWLEDIQSGSPSTVELGRRFAHKLLIQWLDIESASDDLVYCDGSGDGGIDIAYLDRGERGDTGEGEEESAVGHTWYIVQSKYGKAFHGTTTLLEESQKVIESLDGRRPKLSSLAEGLLERLSNFRKQASDRDRIRLVFATELPLSEEEKQVLKDVRAMGRERLGPIFDVESISIETVYRRTLEELVTGKDRIRVPIKANMVKSGEDVLVGTVTLIDLFEFLKAYRDRTEDLDQLYERNVRRFLGGRGKINKGIQETLRNAPERFGLYNNGITIVVTNFVLNGNGNIELIEPFVVNGCQTTKTIWEICYEKLEAGGTGTSPELEEWRKRAGEGVVITKIVRVGDNGEELERAITRYTNSQNAVREKDFLALTTDFKRWASLMSERYEVFLERQRGGWDSRRALQKQRPDIKKFTKAANAFDLLKVYGSGWLGEAGTAFGKNGPFVPNGAIFKKIMEPVDGEDESFGVDDLYAAYQLQCAADKLDFGRGAAKITRKQTKFLFYMIVIDLLKDVMTRAEIAATRKNCTRALLKLFDGNHESAAQALPDAATEVVDGYLTSGTDNCVFDEPAYKNTFNHDLNAFLKWEKLGKTEEDCPRFRNLLAVNKVAMGQKVGGQPSMRETIRTAIAS
ncbi:MAG: AIPR family protein [Dehalococcoidia bacterium]|nr:AIPR family protein [Dehalococcoidia bacterium]